MHGKSWRFRLCRIFWIYVILASLCGIVAVNSASAGIEGHYRYVIVQSAR